MLAGIKQMRMCSAYISFRLFSVQEPLFTQDEIDQIFNPKLRKSLNEHYSNK